MEGKFKCRLTTLHYVPILHVPNSNPIFIIENIKKTGRGE
jgi:hypothetical protein